MTNIALKSWGKSVTRCAAALFGPAACWTAAGLLMAAMLWHNLTAADTIAAGEAVAKDCLLALPWGAAAAVRATISAIKDERDAI